MKRFLCLLVAVNFLLVQTVTPARAVVPLAVYAAAAVGAAVTSAGIGQHYLKTGEMPVYVDKAAGAIASAADMMFTPTVAAYGPLSLVTAASFPAVASVMLGKDAAIGAPLGAIIDYAKNAASGVYQALKDFAAARELQEEFPLPLTKDDYIQTPTGVKKVGSWNSSGPKTPAQKDSWVSSWGTNYGGISPFGVHGSEEYFITGNGGYLLKAVKGSSSENFSCYYASLTNYAGAPTAIPQSGATDWPSLKDDLKGSPPPGVQQDIQDIIRALGESGLATPVDAIPGTADDVSPPPVITAADVAAAIRNIAQGAQVAAQQAAADAASANDLPGVGAAISAGNAADAINDNALNQVEAAEAAERAEADKPEPETFDPVIAAPFETPYDPGAFDIPARFTSFMNNVQSSGLFSFSSGFFNSLPTDGSPIYTIEAGQYGTHTVDLSETLGPGIAVLKTVLLLLFGFLSIRVVILKR